MIYRLVSIPFWVFWSSRQPDEQTSLVEAAKFQSRSGFSGRLDFESDSFPGCKAVRFNPVLGFLVVSTDGSGMKSDGSKRFNPVLGFLVVSTHRTCVRRSTSSSFQSRSGFSGRLDESETGWSSG